MLEVNQKQQFHGGAVSIFTKVLKHLNRKLLELKSRRKANKPDNILEGLISNVEQDIHHCEDQQIFHTIESGIAPSLVMVLYNITDEQLTQSLTNAKVINNSMFEFARGV